MHVRALAELSADDLRRLTRRSALPEPAIRAAAATVCDDVRLGGDGALAEASARFGGGRAQPLVDTGELTAGLGEVDGDVLERIDAAIDAVRRFHEAQLPESSREVTFPGVAIERRWSPLARVGAYVPGGKAAYPSSLIMTVVPAQVAGVHEIVVASPSDDQGALHPVVRATAARLGITEFYAMGGSQAVAALAYGTETIEPVDKIVGPGNAWVTAAKLAVMGVCGIDLPAGPSEVLVVADDSAEARLVAVDLLCQAEHGPDSPAVLVTTERSLAERVTSELAATLRGLDRRELLEKALDAHGVVLVVDSLDEAIEFANAYAAEHVSVLTKDPEAVSERIVNAGSVYVGRWSPESAGDYATGANHVLPTGGLARSYGPLGVADYGSWRQVQTLTEEGLRTIRPTIEQLATAEGLHAHALAASARFEHQEQG